MPFFDFPTHRKRQSVSGKVGMEITILFIVLIGVWLGRNIERMKVKWTLMKGQMGQMARNNHSCCNCCRNNGPRNNGNRNNRNRNNRNRNNYRQKGGNGNRNNGYQNNPKPGAWMN